MGCTPTLAVVLVIAVLETSDEVTAVVVVVVVVVVLVVAVYCICSSVSAQQSIIIKAKNYINYNMHVSMHLKSIRGI